MSCVRPRRGNDRDWRSSFFNHHLIKPVFSAKFNYGVVLCVDGGRASHKLLVIISFSL